MARTTGVDILNIKPDAEMGLGQDTNIPVPAVALDATNQANRDIRLYDHQRQIMKYDQELKNQQKLLEGLATDQVAVGAIEPEDQSYFDTHEQEDRKAFLSVKTMEPDKNGQNPEYADYISKHQKLKDVAAVLQARHVAFENLRTQRAKITTDKELAQFDEFYKKQKGKKVGEIIEPWVKPFGADYDRVNKYTEGAFLENGKPINVPSKTTTETIGPKGTKITTVTKPAVEPKTAPKKTGTITEGLTPNGDLPIKYKEPDKALSYSEVLRKANMDALTPEGFENQQRIRDSFQGNPDTVPKKFLEESNKRLALFHTQNGIPSIKIPGRPGPVNPDNPNDPTGREIDTGEYENQINYRLQKDENGVERIIIADDPTTLAAKIATANWAGDYFVKGQEKFDEAAFKLNMENAKNKADILLKGAQAKAANARAAFTIEKIKDLKSDEEKEKVIGDYWVTNILQQKELGGEKNGQYYLNAIPGEGSASLFAFKGTKNGEAKPVEVFPLGSNPIYGTDEKNPATFGKIIGRTAGNWKPEIVFKGFPVVKDGKITGYTGTLDGVPDGNYEKFVDRKISMKEVASMYENYKKKGYKGTMDDFLRSVVRTGSMDYNLIGQDAEGRPTTVTKKDNIEALKALSNKNYKKGQENPFYEEEEPQ